MSKVLCAMAIVTVLSSDSDGSTPGRMLLLGQCRAAPAAAPAAPEAAPTAPPAPAPQSATSASNAQLLSAAVECTASQPVTPSYRYTYRAAPRIDGSYGLRPAADKINGSY